MDTKRNAIEYPAWIGRSWWLWIAIACCAFHIVEEYAFDWPESARQHFHVANNLTDYLVVNGAFLLLGISGAMIAWRLVAYSLAFPALLFWNAVFHVGASVWAGRMNPGTISSVILLAPAGIAGFVAAYKDGVLSRGRCLSALALGAAVHLFPVLIILLRPRLSY